MAYSILFTKKIKTDLKNVSPFITQVLTRLAKLSLSAQERFRIKLCLEEAVTNAMRHGNKLDPRLSVEVQVRVDTRGLAVKVSDQGKGFRVSAVPDPTKEKNRERLSGRGVYLIKRFMDKVVFTDKGRTVIMYKKLSPSS